MKKTISLLLILATLSPLCVNAFAVSPVLEPPVYESIEEWQHSGDDSPWVRIRSVARSTDYVDYKLVDTITFNDKRLGWHPDFNDWRHVSDYWFSTGEKVRFSGSVTIGFEKFSIKLQVDASTGPSGYSIEADINYESRPWVRGDGVLKVYDIYGYDGFGTQVSYVPKGYTNLVSYSDIVFLIDYR